MSASGRKGFAATPGAYVEATGSPFTLGNGGSTGTIDTALLGRWMSLQIIANASANTLAWEASNDGVTWRAFDVQGTTDVGGTAPSLTSASAVQIFNAAVPARYVRVRVSAFVAGTVTFALLFHPTPAPLHSMAVDTEVGASATPGDTLSTATFTAGTIQSSNYLYNGTNNERQRSTVAGDGLTVGVAAAGQYGWNGASEDRIRTPNIFKTAAVTAAGSTALWTPAAGKKFRLMRLFVMVSEDATQAGAGVETIRFLDAAAAIGVAFSPFVPAIAINFSGELFNSGWVDLGNGYLSSAANNVLNVDLGAALATGTVRAIAIGTEE